jgi:hypothetical protein
MKTIIICVLFCLSVFSVVDAGDIKVVTWTYKVLPEDSLATVEVFTRDGQTNLVRQTQMKDGVISLRSQSFYHNGTEVGNYIYETANGTNTGIASTAGSPYYFNVMFDSFMKPRSAHIVATNLVMLDWFLCTNGVFYPADSSLIREANDRLPRGFPPH